MDHIRFYLLPRIKNTTVSVGQTAANESNHEGFFLGTIMFGKKTKLKTLHGAATAVDQTPRCCVQAPKRV